MCVSYVVRHPTNIMFAQTKNQKYRASQSIMAIIDFNPLCYKAAANSSGKANCCTGRCDAIHQVNSLNGVAVYLPFWAPSRALKSEQTLNRRRSG